MLRDISNIRGYLTQEDLGTGDLAKVIECAQALLELKQWKSAGMLFEDQFKRSWGRIETRPQDLLRLIEELRASRVVVSRCVFTNHKYTKQYRASSGSLKLLDSIIEKLGTYKNGVHVGMVSRANRISGCGPKLPDIRSSACVDPNLPDISYAFRILVYLRKSRDTQSIFQYQQLGAPGCFSTMMELGRYLSQMRAKGLLESSRSARRNVTDGRYRSTPKGESYVNQVVDLAEHKWGHECSWMREELNRSRLSDLLGSWKILSLVPASHAPDYYILRIKENDSFEIVNTNSVVIEMGLIKEIWSETFQCRILLQRHHPADVTLLLLAKWNVDHNDLVIVFQDFGTDIEHYRLACKRL